MSESREDKLHAVLLAYLQAIDRGEKPDPQKILDAHPDLREELAEYFADSSKLEKIAKSMKTAPYGGGVEVSPTIGRVRYFGDYELIDELSHGGMGVVFRARQVSLNRVVALKMILKGELASETDKRRFRQEAEAAANLDHPNIVPIFEVGEHEGLQYFSMKLIAAVPHATGPAATKEKQRQIAQRVAKVARAIDYAHQQGILHRDLKPSNILIDAAGEPYVTDFGLAKRLESAEPLTKTDTIVGTAAYMPPEQAKSEKVLTTAVDTYSLGAVLYEWLTGRPPFLGPDRIAIILQVLEKDPIRPRSLQPSIDIDLETLCMKCLEKSPHARYQAARELAEDLDRYARGEPVLARPPGRVERLVKWVRRKPVLASVYLLGSIVLLLGGLSIGALTMWRQTEKARNLAESLRLEAAQANEKLAVVEYARTIELAYRSYRDCNMQQARSLLKSCDPKQRGWEWRMVNRLCHAEQLVLERKDDKGGKSSLGKMATFSPDGSRILTIGEDCDFVLEWDAKSGELVRTWDTKAGFTRVVAYSSDGSQFLSGGDFGLLHLWDVKKGIQSDEIKCEFGISDAKFSPDGNTIAIQGVGPSINDQPRQQMVYLWDRKAKNVSKKMARKLEDAVFILDFSSDGNTIFLQRGGNVDRWNPKSDEIQPVVKYEEAWHHVHLSPDRKRIVICDWEEKRAIVWDAESGEKLAVLSVGPATFAAFSPDGSILAFAHQMEHQPVQIWHSPTQWRKAKHKLGVQEITYEPHEKIAELRGHTQPVTSVSFSPDGKRLLTNSFFEFTTRVWKVARPPSLIDLWESRGSDDVFTFSGDGKILARQNNDADVVLWNADSGEYLETLIGDPPHSMGYEWRLNADGSRLVVCTNTKTVRMWDVPGKKVLWQLSTPTNFTSRLAFCESGSLVAILSEQDANEAGTTKISTHDSKDGKRIQEIDAKDVQGIEFSPVGEKLATASRDGWIRFWNPRSGQLVSEIKTEMHFFTQIAFSRDGSTLVACGSSDSVHVWDVDSGREILVLRGHVGPPMSASFSPDGKRIVTCGRDRTVKIWDSLTGLDLLSLRSTTFLTQMYAEFNPNGRTLVTSGLDGRIRLWDPEAPR